MDVWKRVRDRETSNKVYQHLIDNLRYVTSILDDDEGREKDTRERHF